MSAGNLTYASTTFYKMPQFGMQLYLLFVTYYFEHSFYDDMKFDPPSPCMNDIKETFHGKTKSGPIC